MQGEEPGGLRAASVYWTGRAHLWFQEFSTYNRIRDPAHSTAAYARANCDVPRHSPDLVFILTTESVTHESLHHPPLAGTQTILVVDDVGVVRKIAFRLLSESGYRVFEAGSASEALEVLSTARQPISLAIVDVILPEVSGVDLVKLVREQWPTTRVIFMSAFPAEVLVREGLDHPNVLFLAKPFTRDELLTRVTEALSPHRRGHGEASRSDRPAS
jgi:CheY-like chemotaxis protein